MAPPEEGAAGGAVAVQSRVIGDIGIFDEKLETWECYIERFEQFSLINGFQDNVKVACLLSTIGPKGYSLLRTLVAPAKPKDKTFQQLTEALQANLSPKPLFIAERFRFYKRDQSSGESVSQYS